MAVATVYPLNFPLSGTKAGKSKINRRKKIIKHYIENRTKNMAFLRPNIKFGILCTLKTFFDPVLMTSERSIASLLTGHQGKHYWNCRWVLPERSPEIPCGPGGIRRAGVLVARNLGDPVAGRPAARQTWRCESRRLPAPGPGPRHGIGRPLCSSRRLKMMSCLSDERERHSRSRRSRCKCAGMSRWDGRDQPRFLWETNNEE